MTSTKRKLLLVVFAVALVVALSAGVVTAFALTTTDTVEYPFTTGAEAFKYAPTWSCGPAGADHWDCFRIKLDEALCLDDVDYLAWQMKVTGYPSLTVGAVEGEWVRRLDVNDANSGGTPVEGANVYFVNEDGTVDSIDIINGAVNLSQRSGMLLMPVKNLRWRWSQTTENKINWFYFTANTKYNSNYKVSTSEIGYYTGEPTDIANYHSLQKFQLTDEHDSYTAAEKAKFNYDAGSMFYPVKGDYPFTNTSVFPKYAPTWKNVEEAEAETAQTLKTPTFNNLALANVKTIAIQIKSTSTVRLLVGALNGNKRIDTKEAKGQTVNFVSESGTKEELTISNDGYVELNGTGALVIPAELLTGDTLTTINQMIFETDSAEFNVVIGEIGYYGTNDAYQLWNAVPNLAEENSSGIMTGIYEKLFVAENSTVTHPTAPQTALKSIAAKETYGDVKVYWQADAENLASHVFYVNGASGSVDIVKDSYDADALQVQATAKDGDGFMAMDVTNKIISAEGTRGITFWAKNPSDHEISFNIEMDVRYKPTAEAVRYQNTRINITQGNRIWLYDVNTGKQTIAMTRPTTALPAHFEGWVRIPFACFDKASWSKGDHTFMFENGVAKADTFISYLAISYDTHTFPINQPFVVNNFGTYTTTPLYNSALVSNPTMTIPALMDNLPALPQVNEEV